MTEVHEAVEQAVAHDALMLLAHSPSATAPAAPGLYLHLSGDRANRATHQDVGVGGAPRSKGRQAAAEHCLDLGRDRNRVKHRGLRHEAEGYVEKYEQAVYSVAHNVTGIDAMPRSAHMLRGEEAGERLLPPPMFNRWGEPRRFSRY
jgi:hypothetical protein